jgi:tellurite resistance protein
MFVITVLGAMGSYLLIVGFAPKKTLQRPLPTRRVEELPKEPTFHSRVAVTEQTIDEIPCKFFSVGIRGEVDAPADRCDINMQVVIEDVTGGRYEPVLCMLEQFQRPGTSFFLYDESKGKLPSQKTILSDWITVASIRADTLRLPRKGLRKLQFITSVIASQTKKVLAESITTCLYDNPEYGYVELLRNSTRTKELTIPLAISLASIDGRPKDEEIKVIKQWMLENFDLQDGRKSDAQREQFQIKLEKALEQAVKFFTSGGRLDVRAACREIVKISPAGLRLDIMRLFLNVAKSDGIVTQPEMIVINKFASWLQVERTKFRAMLEQLIPLSICQVKDADVLLGITADMDSEAVCKYLNEEYRRWNSRVTNTDAKIRDQAGKMLDIVAQARNAYTLESAKS